MLFSKLITTVALAASATINALPNPAPLIEVERDNERSIVARGLPKDFVKHAAAAIKAFGPEKTKTMMHSGIGASKAFQVSKGKKLQTVETTILKAIVDDKKHKNTYKDTLQKYCVDKKEYCEIKGGNLKDWIEAWNTISKEWAEFAEKETTLATTKKGPDPDSFYKRIEERILNDRHIQITVDDKE
ncbi:hypothetical protein QQS21_006451 [Conoideocrella luteorostrata]|uniref:Uncharacterized protein n=1 Tax=Conoideocrella luteorostrata TaxID=1105319 RepID=A0AAJ0CRT0_9HYPO|nr:hypothetical protein QQS21_006451 [Conoideocrella luteorostrata]